MFQVKSPSLASSRNLTNTARSRCFGLVSSRIATLLLALFGLIAHMQTFKHLEVLYDSFPQVPLTRNEILPVSPLFTSLNEHKYANGRNGPRPSINIRPSVPADVVLDSEMIIVNDDQRSSTSQMQSSKMISHILPADTASVSWSTSDLTGSNTVSKAKSVAAAAAAMSSEDLIAMVKPTRWFNMLPKRPWTEEKATPEEAAIWRAQLKDQDEERKSWEAARVLTTIMRFYSIASALACLFGIYGVLKSNLLATRFFLISSLIDLFLFTLSIMSLCVIVTYPEVRAMLCEQISSGELHSLFNYMRVTDSSSSSSTSSFDASTTDASLALSDPANTVLPAANFISRSASAIWKRASVSDSNNGNSSSHVYWWDMLLDDMLENESCDDIFLSVLVPIGLFACLIYIAVRIHFLVVIRAYYTSLIRQAVGLYLEPSHVVINKNTNNHLFPLSEKGRKYSTSSSSSSTIVEMSNSRSNASLLSEKALNEKLA